MLKKRLLTIGGTLSLALGIAGILLPVLPTTPFLLLAAYCYVRGSGRLYERLMNHRILGVYLQNYLKYRAISKTAKIASLLALWVSLSVSAAVIGDTAVRGVLALVGIGVTAHLLALKTLPEEMTEGSGCGRAERKAGGPDG